MHFLRRIITKSNRQNGLDFFIAQLLAVFLFFYLCNGFLWCAVCF